MILTPCQNLHVNSQKWSSRLFVNNLIVFGTFRAYDLNFSSRLEYGGLIRHVQLTINVRLDRSGYRNEFGN